MDASDREKCIKKWTGQPTYDQSFSLAPPPPGDEHDCAWQEYAKALTKELDSTREQLDVLKAQFEELRRTVYGKKSEKMPPMDREVRRGQKADQEQRIRARQANAALRAKTIKTEIQDVKVPDDQRHCPKCGGDKFSELGEGKPSSVTEYVPGYFRRRVFRRQVLACSCGQHVVTAPVPDKVFDRTQYGPCFLAYLVVSKCCDSMPIHRLEKQFARLGIPMARSTMNELFNRVGELLSPLAATILRIIAQREIVLADETPQRMQSGKKGYMWTFISGKLVAFRFSPSRSGDTPKQVLGGTTGTLVVDMYTGYNKVTGTGGRERSGCHSHVRRKFFEAKNTAPEAETALEFIRQIYVLEHEVRAAGVIGTEEHARVRWQETLPVLDKFYVWLAEQKDLHRPKSKMGLAIQYTMKNWQSLTRFIRNVAIPPDNNRSERELRIVALLRKNSLFVGHKEAGNNLAALLTVVATCLANEVDPLAYLTDILTRLDSTPESKITSLLPENWAPAA